jgi:hypothetical protein
VVHADQGASGRFRLDAGDAAVRDLLADLLRVACDDRLEELLPGTLGLAVLARCLRERAQ